jgi:hypothetical protein
MVASTYLVVHQTTRDEIDNTTVDTSVIADTSAVQRFEHELAFHEILDGLREAVARNKKGAPDRYVATFDDMLAGRSVEQIADRLGVKPNRAKNIMAGVRGAIRKAEDQATDARHILYYVREEPYATLDDLTEDLTLKSKLNPLLKELVQRGRLVRNDDGSLLLTPKGHSLLSQWEERDDDDFAIRVAL